MVILGRLMTNADEELAIKRKLPITVAHSRPYMYNRTRKKMAMYRVGSRRITSSYSTVLEVAVLVTAGVVSVDPPPAYQD